MREGLPLAQQRRRVLNMENALQPKEIADWNEKEENESRKEFLSAWVTVTGPGNQATFLELDACG